MSFLLSPLTLYVPNFGTHVLFYLVAQHFLGKIKSSTQKMAFIVLPLTAQKRFLKAKNLNTFIS